ncbi:MAG: hypothetical protein K8R91_02515 [Phycisphaerae bacterium]|nr:hypothetical protein [Phycisphaerae bacterium]
MDDLLAKRVRSAAVAGWWTVLIAAVWMTAGWFAFLAFLHYQPEWLLKLWGGGDLDWTDVQGIVLWFFAVFKLMLFAVVMVVIWLTLWSKRLKREG